MSRVVILVADSLGIGHAPDADKFGDVNANTLAHLAEEYNQQTQQTLSIPNLASLGLVKACELAANTKVNHTGEQPSKGAYAYAAEISSGKDTPSGHWEMAGVPVLFDWDYYSDKTNSFPAELHQDITQATGIDGMLGNCHASGTVIISQLGEEHIKTGLPICYTSSDSVFQVAAHEEHFGLDRLYKYCQDLRKMFDDKGINLGRIIARPFIGENADTFERTGNRRDYSVLPPAKTVLDKLADKGQVISIGKIADIFAHQGITTSIKATGLEALIDSTIEQLGTAADNSLIFTNLVNFDQDYGHRRDSVGYAKALEYFDGRMNDIINAMNDDDWLFITADHGCDPTWPGSDHTREYVPQLVFKKNMPSINLGERSSFADMGQTICDIFELESMEYGESYLTQLNT